MKIEKAVKILKYDYDTLKELYDGYKKTNVNGDKPVREWEDKLQALSQAIKELKLWEEYKEERKILLEEKMKTDEILKRVDDVEGMKEAIRYIPSTKIPISLIDGKKYYYMNKEDILLTLSHWLKGGK